MPNKMLIDASHPEETRVVVTRGQKVEEFDFESATRRPERESEQRHEERSRGGGGRRRRGASRRNRDRDATVSGQADEGASPDGQLPPERGEAEPDGVAAVSESSLPADEGFTDFEPSEARMGGDEPELPGIVGEPGDGAGHEASDASAPEPAEALDAREVEDLEDSSAPFEDAPARSEGDDEESGADEEEDEDEDELEEHEVVEQVGGGDALEDVPERPRVQRRHYKIQEVIKRRQILLVQVVKEERGNKGAALTTYLSLAGRYSVLMPNTGKGGGISRKITSAEDRKRLKEVVEDLEVPEGMGIILRTAGANRTKPEIKRDFEYLMRLWESVRELTLTSSAPALVYEEGSLVKRAIRDLYNKDIDDVIVAGEEGYGEARDFMKMIMPSQARAVQPYREAQPLFAAHGVEAQLDAMFSNHVTLRSGGYLVINPTEALVSIDVNSGRSTREHNIEDTALRTNLEAAEEIARQLRLRDLAGLIVIDFIDMDERRNDRSVEKKLKDCLKNDRARIQVGRISPFGLLEMSRQRIRTGVLESSSIICPHCGGAGHVRAVPSVALQILRSVEESLLRSAAHNLVVRTKTPVAIYILNGKRAHLRELETRFGVAVAIMPDDTITGTTTFAIDRGDPAEPAARKPSAGVRVDTIMPVDEPIEIEPTAEYEREEEAEAEALPAERSGDDEDASGRRRRRRRRRSGRGPRDREGFASENGEASPGDEDEDDPAGAVGQAEPDPDEQAPVMAALDGEPAEVEAEVVSASRSYTDGPSSVRSAPVGSLDEVPTTRPNALTDIGADGPSAEPAIEQENLPSPEPEPVAIVLTPPDPDRPKRGGWWAKTKAAISGS